MVSLFSLIFITLMSLGLVLTAPTPFGPADQMPSDHVQELAHNSQPLNFFTANHAKLRIRRPLRRRSSHPSLILMPVKSGNVDLAESLLNAANVLLCDTTAVFSTISFLKKNGQLSTPEKLDDGVVFQLTEWQKHADMLRFLGDVKERTDFADHVEDLKDGIDLTLNNAAQALKDTLSGVNSIIAKMPSIQYVLGPMVYNIRTIIADIHHRSEALSNTPSSRSSYLEEDNLMCSMLHNIKQFC